MTKKDFVYDIMDIEYETIDPELTHYNKSFLNLPDYKVIRYYRKVSEESIRYSNLQTMPGFQLK